MKKYINIILSISLLIPVYGRENPNDNASSTSIWSRFAGKTTAIDQYSLINIGNMVSATIAISDQANRANDGGGATGKNFTHCAGLNTV